MDPCEHFETPPHGGSYGGGVIASAEWRRLWGLSFKQERRPALSTYTAVNSYGDMMFVLDTIRGNPTATLADL